MSEQDPQTPTQEVQTSAKRFAHDLSQHSLAEWYAAMQEIGTAHGFHEPLGKAHSAYFIERGDTLVVSFENVDGVRALSETHTPLGFEMRDSHGWSSLTVLSRGDTWFRDPKVYGFFDQLSDDGFFDDFEQVLFFGAGPAGYAAAAYSVSCPGARVLALAPQASLDPRVSEWDDRFVEQRRRDFTSRYGFAPDMIDGADAVSVIYDPRERLDAMHAALFTRSNVTRLRVPSMGGALYADFRAMDLMPALLEQAALGQLDDIHFAQLMRARRVHLPYLKRLLSHTDRQERHELSKMVCRHILQDFRAPRIRRKLSALEAMDEQS